MIVLSKTKYDKYTAQVFKNVWEFNKAGGLNQDIKERLNTMKLSYGNGALSEEEHQSFYKDVLKNIKEDFNLGGFFFFDNDYYLTAEVSLKYFSNETTVKSLEETFKTKRLYRDDTYYFSLIIKSVNDAIMQIITKYFNKTLTELKQDIRYYTAIKAI